MVRSYVLSAPLHWCPLHGVGASPPVPHWVVLLAAVPTFWLLVAALVLAVDRLLGGHGEA
ncbi:hypothetical protein [Halosimplex halophilum]|uniref:hypothetical protein n=1 Tax=Halosimplex halophilum TaxID=2559572 RepID=UPI00107F3653|nr:hypothetical protein [Halosimplex halophilum]